MVKVAQSHTNYQCSMLLEDIVGITNLEVTAPIFDKKSHNLLGILSLCQVLLRYLQLSDGHQLITEVHQPNKIMGPVQAFIPNTPKAERTILMMNMNVPSYIENALKDQGMPESFLIDLVKNSCCPTQVSEIMNCTWDPDTGTLTTHQKAAEEKNRVVLETALWFKDAFANLGTVVNGKPKQQAPPPKTLFNLNEYQSVETVHHRHEQAAIATGHKPPRKGKGTVVDVTNSDEESAFSSGKDRPRTAAAVGDEDSLTSLVQGMRVTLWIRLMADSWYGASLGGSKNS